MEKPALEKVIEKLEEVDIQMWGMSNTYAPGRGPFPLLTAEVDGLIFDVGSYCKKGVCDILSLFNDMWYVINVQDGYQKVFIEYKEDSQKGKIYRFYDKLYKDVKEFKKDELNRRVQDLVYSSEPGRKDIEKIVKKLEDIDFKDWETDIMFDKKHKPKRPSFVAKLYGLNIYVQKGHLGSYNLKISNPERNTEIIYGKDTDSKTRRAEKGLIKNLYEKLYKELEGKEKGFEEKLNNFLSK